MSFFLSLSLFFFFYFDYSFYVCFSFFFHGYLLISLSIFTFWYSIQYLANINWEVLLLTKLGKLCLPRNFWLQLTRSNSNFSRDSKIKNCLSYKKFGLHEFSLKFQFCLITTLRGVFSRTYCIHSERRINETSK